jgi:chitinase
MIGHNAPLYPRSDQHGEASFLNVDWSVNYWIENGMNRNKIVLGLPAYGRSFRLFNSKSNQLGSKALRSGTAGPFTKESGFLSYYEICDKLKKQGWKYEWNDEHQAPYAYNSKEWVIIYQFKRII